MPNDGKTYSLLLKGGHVIDPANGIDGVRDVAISAPRRVDVTREQVGDLSALSPNRPRLQLEHLLLDGIQVVVAEVGDRDVGGDGLFEVGGNGGGHTILNFSPV